MGSAPLSAIRLLHSSPSKEGQGLHPRGAERHSGVQKAIEGILRTASQHVLDAEHVFGDKRRPGSLQHRGVSRR